TKNAMYRSNGHDVFSLANPLPGGKTPPARLPFSVEDDLVALHLGMHHGTRDELAGEDLLGQRVFDPALDGALERPRPVNRVVTHRHQLVQRLVADLQAQLALGQALAQT